MRKVMILIVVLLALLIAPALAINPNPPGKLEIIVAISGSPRYIEDWVKKPSSQPIVIKRLKQLKLGGTAYIGFIITGHRTDPNGTPNLEVDYVIRKPDGSIVFQEESAAKVQYKTGEGGFVMADPALDFTVDPGDPLGTWRVEATVRDILEKSEAKGTAKILVVE